MSDDIYDPRGPVLHTDTGKRLDALVRRFGGKPTSIEPINGRVILPSVGRRTCKDQLAFDDGDDEPS